MKINSKESKYVFDNDILGTGSFGIVSRATNTQTGEKVAAKLLPDDLYNDKTQLNFLSNEILISTEFKNDHLCKVKDIEEIDNQRYIMYEYCNGGDLKKYLDKRILKLGSPFPEKDVQAMMSQILDGLSCLHRNKIIHYDIKPENILLQFPNENDKENFVIKNCILKISDFGLSKFKCDKNSLSKIYGGSPLYMDPALFNPSTYVEDEKADIWSIGILAYELLTGKHPFVTSSNTDKHKLMENIFNGKFLVNVPNISIQALSFMNCCLQLDYRARFSAQELTYHEFIIREWQYFEKVNTSMLPPIYKGLKDCIVMDAKDNRYLSSGLGVI